MRNLGQRNVARKLRHRWVVGGLTGLTGILSQIFDTLYSRDEGVTHIFFGLLLSLGVVVRFDECLWSQASRLRPTEIEQFVRRSNRLVYVLLYGLLLVKQLLNLSEGIVGPPQGFLPYLIAGVFAVLLTRALGYASLRDSHPSMM